MEYEQLPKTSTNHALRIILKYAFDCRLYPTNTLGSGQLELPNSVVKQTQWAFIYGRKTGSSKACPPTHAPTVVYGITTTTKPPSHPKLYVERLLKSMPNADKPTDGIIGGFLPWSPGIPITESSPLQMPR